MLNNHVYKYRSIKVRTCTKYQGSIFCTKIYCNYYEGKKLKINFDWWKSWRHDWFSSVAIHTCLDSVVRREFNIISSSHDSAPSAVGSTMGSGDRLQVRYAKGSYKDVNENDEDHRDGDSGVVIVTPLVILLAETRILDN